MLDYLFAYVVINTTYYFSEIRSFIKSLVTYPPLKQIDINNHSRNFFNSYKPHEFVFNYKLNEKIYCINASSVILPNEYIIKKIVVIQGGNWHDGITKSYYTDLEDSDTHKTIRVLSAYTSYADNVYICNITRNKYNLWTSKYLNYVKEYIFSVIQKLRNIIMLLLIQITII
jgi:hypothetical protein